LLSIYTVTRFSDSLT